MADPLLLSGIVGGQLSEVVDGRCDFGACALLGLEKALIASDDVAAPSGLGVLQQAEHAGEALQDDVRVRHRVAGSREGVDAAIGHGADCCQEHERQREAGRDLLATGRA